MTCPYCKAENPDAVRFCVNCGRQLNAAAQAGIGASRLLTPGARLQGGRYLIKRVLGQGGMGAALLATDIRLNNKLVVIKELISDQTDAQKLQSDVRNFKREVAMLAHIDHPLVPNVTDQFQEGTRYFMVQEYVEGENLDERLNRTRQPMREKEALVCASEVLDVLDYLAQQTPPIVHRDIKPTNIIISSKDMRAHLVDFGIARRNEQQKQTSALGTPGYAPPEQYQGQADARSDLYALAATLHHVLTNRDPRNHPAFVYPPVRSINPQLSPEIERVLVRALSSDVKLRYQTATEMKEAIDDILRMRFGVSGNIHSSVAHTSAPTVIMAPSPPTPVLPMAAATPLPMTPPTPLVPVGIAQVTQSSQGPRRRWLLPVVIVLLLLLIVGGLVGTFAYLRGRTLAAKATPTVVATVANTGAGTTPVPTPNANGIGVTLIDNEPVGISDGSVAFDTNRSGGNYMLQAATKMAQNDAASALSLWQSAINSDTGNAEALIYLENQRVLASGNPYVTFVVATMLTGTNYGVGRDDLQGAYVAQKEYNDGSKLGSIRVRLLIANTGNNAQSARLVAQQIVNAAQHDKTIIGVMGWPFSNYTLSGVSVLAAAHMPMVSQTASSDALTGISSYFFRVAPSNKTQATVGASYALRVLGAKNVALFVDPANTYSQSLAQDFSQAFGALGGHIAVTEQYTVGKPDTLPTLLDVALKTTPTPDLIYFAGYATDVSTILTNLPNYTQFPNLRVMGGDALYNLSGYPSSARAGFNRLRFTSFAYPDEWKVAGLGGREPTFFTAYPAAFDPNHLHVGNPYGYTRPNNDVILSYDAMLALFKGCQIAFTGGKTSITADVLQQALTQINGKQAIQGVSGRIAFDAKGDPLDKSVVILEVDPQGYIKMEPKIQGTFLLGS